MIMWVSLSPSKKRRKKRSTIPPCSIFFGVCFMSSTFLLNYNGDSNLCTLTHILMSEPAELAAGDCNNWPFASIFFNVIKVQAWIFYNLNIWYKLLLTLLYWILLMSRADWGMPGNLCFRSSKIVSALSSNCSFFSILTAEPQDFASLLCMIFLFQMTTEASIRFLILRILCSVDRSSVEKNWSGSKNSTVILW